MKVYIITNDPFPNGMAAVNRIKCYSKALIYDKQSCKVIAIRRLEQDKSKPTNGIAKGEFEGVPYEYIGGTTYRCQNHFLRVLHDYLDKISTLLFLLKNLENGDVVLGYVSNEISFINIVIRITHLKKAKFVKELCEIPFGHNGDYKKGERKRQRMEKSQLPICDGIISISDALTDYVKSYTKSNCRIIKIPILVDCEKFNIQRLQNEIKRNYIFHSGTLTEQKDGILGMIEAFGLAVKKDNLNLEFVCTGSLENSPHKDEIERLIEKYNLHQKLVFVGYLSEEELRNMINGAKMVIINKYPNLQNKYCFSTKLSEYMAAGVPVIITRVGEAMNWLIDGENALIVDSCNVDALSDAISRLAVDENLCSLLSHNSRSFCRNNFDYRVYGNKMTNFFNSIYKLS